jgi:hypothetical protein
LVVNHSSLVMDVMIDYYCRKMVFAQVKRVSFLDIPVIAGHYNRKY